MTRAEHYFENLIYDGKDVSGEPNKNALSEEVRNTIEMCYEYILNNIFIDRENLDDFLKRKET